MSDYLAVGAVTAVLTWLLTDTLTAGGPASVFTSSDVTAVPPDQITVGSEEDARLNLFMYYVSLNPALRNLDLPSVDAAGNRVSNAPLALNLHYLVSAYGGRTGVPLTTEVLLGWAMKVFHDNAVVPSATIQAALDALAGPPPSLSAAALAVADSTNPLSGQIEHIRITPEALTTEEIYRLWPAFNAPYRPSTAYQVSVVVIQDTTPVPVARPVEHRRVVALPRQSSPVISGVSPAKATAGQQLTITGAGLAGQVPADTMVFFEELAAPVTPDKVTGSALTVTVPPALLAGTRTVRVQRMTSFPPDSREDPPAPLSAPRRGPISAPVSFQLVPAIQDSSPVSATRGAPLTLSVSPPAGRAQQVTVYIGDTAIPVGQLPPSAPETSPTITVTIPAGTATGTFPLRVKVDGASSAPAQVAVT